MTRALTGLAIAGALVVGTPAAAQSPGAADTSLPFAFDGPPPPIAPAVITRDAAGRATIRAVRLAEPLRVDGVLDEPVYSTVPPFSDFVQMEPHEGAPATEKTDMWILFDRDRVYIVARCWETQPDRMVATEMRRDNPIIYLGNDVVAFMLDTFYDRRNALVFNVNAIGGRTEGQSTDEGQYNGDFNLVWEVQVGRFENGWTVEAAVPFKSLRYRPGREQVWGFQARRNNRWKNEASYLTPLPKALGIRGILHASMAATVVGLEAPPRSMNIEVKPYAIANATAVRAPTAAMENELKADAGIDVKYGVTQNLTADFTYNTDFAQVEADEQQINLTRFSLFFPEKRDFFLENRGTFSFGGAIATGTGGDTPILFYSRRIGLNQDKVVPIHAGVRLTGRVDRYTVGALTIQTDDEPVSGFRSTNFSVVRLKRDVLRRSSIGFIGTGRSVAQSGLGSNAAYGVDGSFAFFDSLAINGYWARTQTANRSGHESSYRASLDYVGDRYGVQVERLAVGDAFNPEAGFVRRPDMRKTFGQFRFSPRPRSIASVRRFSWLGSILRIDNSAGRLETRTWNAEFAVEFHNTDRFSVAYAGSHEFLPQPFQIAPDITLPIGGYDFAGLRVAHVLGQHRKLSGTLAVEHGTFYDGRRSAVTVSQGRLNLLPQFTMEPTYSLNHVDLAQGSFRTHLVGSRVTYTITPLIFTSALVQYNSSRHVATANVRLRWEYEPGSELFVVYDEERDTLARGMPEVRNRAFVVKMNRLFRF